MAVSKWPEVKDKLIQVEAWCRDGLIEAQIATNLGISVATLEVYKHDHPEFVEALKRGKEVVDIQVENKLFKRAMGYEYDEVKTVVDDEGKVTVTKTIKEVVPDTTAQIYWLKNRKPREWRDKQDIESINTNLNYEIPTTEDEIDKRISELINKTVK